MEFLFRQLASELSQHGLIGFAVLLMGAAIIMLWRRADKQQKIFDKHKEEVNDKAIKEQTTLVKIHTEIHGSLKSIDSRLERGDKKIDKIDGKIEKVQQDVARLEGATSQ